MLLVSLPTPNDKRSCSKNLCRRKLSQRCRQALLKSTMLKVLAPAQEKQPTSTTACPAYRAQSDGKAGLPQARRGWRCWQARKRASEESEEQPKGTSACCARPEGQTTYCQGQPGWTCHTCRGRSPASARTYGARVRPHARPLLLHREHLQ